MKLFHALLVCAVAVSSQVLAADSLPPLKAETSRISVSGLSSGAAMATQLSVAYSDLVEGVGMMAGPPYACAQGASRTAVVSCLTMNIEAWGIKVPSWALGPRDNVDLSNLIATARSFSSQGKIPSLDNLEKQKVWVSRGTLDQIVGPNVTQAVRVFYKELGALLAPPDEPPVPHTLPTDKPGLGDCDGRHEDPDYVSSCGIDNVGRMFAYFFGWRAEERGKLQVGNLKWFDQTPYIESSPGRRRTPGEMSMAKAGRVYVPSGCENGGCKIHVAIHGCRQGSDAAFDVFSREGGYNEWAESHRMIVLYPRVVASNSLPVNPRGCWDWWGYAPYDNSDWRAYAKRDGPQMLTIMNMVQALARHP